MASNGKYDFVIYGATGFTGQFVVEEVARVAEIERKKLDANKPNLSFAVAGRNSAKLHNSIEEAKKLTGLPLDNVGVIEADVNNQESIDAMTKQAKVVINCVGPYMKWGEAVVKSCVENGVNHVDISGEPAFLEGMQLKYNKAAEEKGVHIVGACGYDSIPPEMGINFLEKLFPGGLNSVEHYTRAKCSTGKVPSINTGTMESALGVFETRELIAEQRRKLFTTKLPKRRFKLKNRGFAHYNHERKCYGVPLPSDEPVVYRSQRYRHDKLGLNPIQYYQYLSQRTLLQAIGMTLSLGYIMFISMFEFTRNLAIKYPSQMTAGFFKRGGIDKEALSNTTFTATLVGKGWKEPLAEPSDEHSFYPDTTKVLQITGPDPGYGATSLMMVASAMTILREKENCREKGGVLTPGVAFANTRLIDRLLERGMKFEIEE